LGDELSTVSEDVTFCALFIDVQADKSSDIANIEAYNKFFIIFWFDFLIFIVTEINSNQI
jgi:hypothetical protein